MRKLYWLEHRVYEWLKENIPDGTYTIEHICKNEHGEWLRIEYNDVVIAFDYANEAMRFKLTWG